MTLTLTMNLTVTINTWELVTALFPRPTLISVDLFSFFPCRAQFPRNTFPAGLCCHFHLKHLSISVHSLVVDLKFQMLLSLNPTEMYNVHREAIQCLMSPTAWHNLSCLFLKLLAWHSPICWQSWPDVLMSLCSAIHWSCSHTFLGNKSWLIQPGSSAKQQRLWHDKTTRNLKSQTFAFCFHFINSLLLY